MKKIFIAISLLMLLFIVAIVAVPLVFENEIKTFVLDQANNEIEGKVSFEDFSLSLIPNFPKMTAQIEGVHVQSHAAKMQSDLFYCQEISLTLDLLPLLSNEVNVVKFMVIAPQVHAFIAADGRANYELVKDSTATSGPSADEDINKQVPTQGVAQDESDFKLNIQEYAIVDGKILYEDFATHSFIEIVGLNHSGKGDFSLSNFILETTTQIDEINVTQEGISYLKKAVFESNINLKVNLDESKYIVDSTFAQLNALVLNSAGWVQLHEDQIEMDMKIWSLNNSFGELFSLIPGAYIADYANVKSKGEMSVETHFSGSYYDTHYPAFDILVRVKNGFVQYPGYDIPAKNIGLDLAINHPGGDLNRMGIALKRASLNLDENELFLSLNVDNALMNPNMNGKFKAHFNLASIPKFMPTDKKEKYTGTIESDLKFKADLNSLNHEVYENMEASGSLVCSDISYNPESYPFELNEINMVFDLNKVQLNALKGRYTSSVFDAKGQMENFIPYYLGNGVLTANLEFGLDQMNVSEWMSAVPQTEEEPVSVETEEKKSPEGLREERGEAASTAEVVSVTEPLIPDNILLTLSSKIGKIEYDGLIMDRFSGILHIENGVLSCKNVGCEIFSGQATMNGAFDFKSSFPHTTFSMDYDMKNWKVSDVGTYANSIDQLVPILKSTKGDISGGVSAHGILDDTLGPILDSISFTGNFSSKSLSFSSTTLEKVNTITKTKQFNPLSVQDVQVDFKCHNGILETAPFEVKLGTTKATVSGYTTLNSEINYIVKTTLKTNELGSAAGDLLGQLNAQLKNTGVSIPETIPVAIAITGDIQDPSIKPVFNTGDASKKVQDQVKDQVEKKIQEVKEDAKKAARLEAEKLINDAKKQQEMLLKEAQKQADLLQVEAKKLGNQLRAEADKQAKDLEKQATNPLTKMAAKKAGEELRKKADTKAKDLEKEAKKQGDNLINTAKAESDKLMKDAELKAQKIIEEA